MSDIVQSLLYIWRTKLQISSYDTSLNLVWVIIYHDRLLLARLVSPIPSWFHPVLVTQEVPIYTALPKFLCPSLLCQEESHALLGFWQYLVSTNTVHLTQASQLSLCVSSFAFLLGVRTKCPYSVPDYLTFSLLCKTQRSSIHIF